LSEEGRKRKGKKRSRRDTFFCRGRRKGTCRRRWCRKRKICPRSKKGYTPCTGNEEKRACRPSYEKERKDLTYFLIVTGKEKKKEKMPNETERHRPAKKKKGANPRDLEEGKKRKLRSSASIRIRENEKISPYLVEEDKSKGGMVMKSGKRKKDGNILTVSQRRTRSLMSSSFG